VAFFCIWGCSPEMKAENQNQDPTEREVTFLEKYHQTVWKWSSETQDRYLYFQNPTNENNLFLVYHYDLKEAAENYCNSFAEGNYLLVGILLYEKIEITENSSNQFSFRRKEQGEDFFETLTFLEDESGNMIQKFYSDGILLRETLFGPTAQSQSFLTEACAQ